MKKTVTVKKNKVCRLMLRFLFVIISAVSVVVAVLWLRQPVAILIFSPAILLNLAILLYHEKWQISFLENKIEIIPVLSAASYYSYHQITDAVVGYSYTERGYVSITFTDGKRIRFRIEDENAIKAVQQIKSHRSIRTIN